MAVGQAAQTLRCMPVCRRRIFQVGDRVAIDTVRPTLKQDELRHIELGTGCSAFTALLCHAGTGIKKAAIFVQVCKNQLRVIFKTVEHPVTMVRIDIDIGNTLQAIL